VVKTLEAMSFHQDNKKKSEGRRAWGSFCEENSELIRCIGLPSPTIETQDRFEDLLMHGYIDHHDDWSSFGLDQLSEEQFQLLKQLVANYFEAGYLDPGVIWLGLADKKKLVLKYPKQFHPHDVELFSRSEELEERR
jgi:hypothetical protein